MTQCIIIYHKDYLILRRLYTDKVNKNSDPKNAFGFAGETTIHFVQKHSLRKPSIGPNFMYFGEEDFLHKSMIAATKGYLKITLKLFVLEWGVSIFYSRPTAQGVPVLPLLWKVCQKISSIFFNINMGTRQIRRCPMYIDRS
jgi:hypothetical protein